MANVKATETIIPNTLIATGEFSLDKIAPTTTTQYPRNDFGTAVVDANTQNVDNSRLVINLVGKRYVKSRFETIIPTEFEEFLDPEPQEFDEANSAAGAADLSAELAAKSNQLDSANKKIDELLSLTNQLQNDLNNINIPQTQTNDPNKDTKGRIFTDGTMIRDRDSLNFYYIIENGLKRWFWFNYDLALAAAKAFGKIKQDGTIDFIDVPQFIIDRIPSGANFEVEDLVKNKNTPAPPPLELPDGKDIISSWDVPNNTIVIEVDKLEFGLPKILVPLRYTSAKGKVNMIEFWDDSIPWTESKPQLPARPENENVTFLLRKQQNNVGDWGLDTKEFFEIHIADTSVTANTNGLISREGNLSINAIKSNNEVFLSRYQPFKFTKEGPKEISIPIRAKLFNDTSGEGFSDVLNVIIKFVGDKMPSVVGLPLTEAENAIRFAEIENAITLTPGAYTTDKAKEYIVYKAIPNAGTAILNPTDKVELQYYRPEMIPVQSWIQKSTNYNTYIQKLRKAGFTSNIIFKIQREKTTAGYHATLDKIYTRPINTTTGYWVNTSGIPAGVKYNNIFEITVIVYENAKDRFNRLYSSLSNESIIQDLKFKSGEN